MARITQEKHSSCFISIVVFEKLVDEDRVKCQKTNKQKANKKTKVKEKMHQLL